MIRIEASLALIERDGRWFLQRRDLRASFLPGHWEFPGGKHEVGESPREALRRELLEELVWEPDGIEALPPLRDLNGERELLLHPFRCTGLGILGTPLAWGWFTAAEIRRLRIPPANAALLAHLDSRGI